MVGQRRRHLTVVEVARPEAALEARLVREHEAEPEAGERIVEAPVAAGILAQLAGGGTRTVSASHRRWVEAVIGS